MVSFKFNYKLKKLKIIPTNLLSILIFMTYVYVYTASIHFTLEKLVNVSRSHKMNAFHE